MALRYKHTCGLPHYQKYNYLRGFIQDVLTCPHFVQMISVGEKSVHDFIQLCEKFKLFCTTGNLLIIVAVMCVDKVKFMCLILSL